MINILIAYLLIIPVLSVGFGIFGCFAVWEKNSFFGHTFSHSLLLPISIALLFKGFSYITLSIVIFSVFFVLFFVYLSHRAHYYYNQDTLLIIVSFFCLSFALIANSFSSGNTDIMSFMSGDIILVNKTDIAILYIVTIVTVFFYYKFRKILILNTISMELSMCHNKKIPVIHGIFLLLQALFVACSIRATGVLLVSATLLMPAIVSRIVSNTTKSMIFVSIISSLLTMLITAMISMMLNIQFAPILIFEYCVIFAILYLVKLTR